MPLLSALLVVASAVTALSKVQLAQLRCEYLPNPVCIESHEPRLSWTSQTSERGWTQSAYQVLVASEPDKLAEGRADLWDSGRVESAESLQINYAGKPLGSRLKCYWKVRVWDGAGTSSAWSKAQTWQMGLLSAADWADSQWIGGAVSGTEPLPAPYLRKEFAVEGKVKQAFLFASGLGYAELSLNGKKLGGASERDPGYTNFDKRVLYVGHDVTPSIKEGKNALGAILGTGWYDVHDLATWRFERAPWRGRPRLRLVLFVDYVDGRTQEIASDASWKTSSGPILTDGIYTGETYDARREITGWDVAGFNDQAWEAAKPMPAPKGVLASRPCPPVEITETIKATKISEPKPGVYVVDFGQNIAGHVRLNVQGPAGAQITMRYSERVHPDGMIERSQIDTYMTKTTPPQPFQTDTYICKGTGREEWEQRFSYSGFRYAEVTGFPGTPSLSNFEARLATTHLESAGEFECSNELLNKIQRATLYSYRSNAQSIPTDCPQREKNGWTGDAQLAAEAGLMNFRSESFYTKWLDDLADDQQRSGGLSLIVPSGGWGRGACHPAWDSAFAIIAEDLYEYRKDSRALERHYDSIRRYVDFLSGQTKDGVVPFDSLGDWLPWSTQTPSQLTSTIFLYVDARIVSEAALRLGKNADVEKYGELAETVKAAFNRHFLAPETLDQSSQAALSMAVYFGLSEGSQKKAQFDALVRNVERQGHIDTGILGAKFILRALSEGGRTDLAYKLVARKEQPGWGWWIGQGATTLWEDWKGESSLNHIMFGDVSNWFFQWIAGIGLDPKSPAFKHILVRPQPVGELTWAKGAEDGPYGRIASSWRRDGNRFQLDLEIPPNSSATVRVPGKADPLEGAKLVARESDATVFEVTSGSYRFESDLQ